MAMLISTALGLLNIPDNIATPCSVNANGAYLEYLPRPVSKDAICVLRALYSSRVSSNHKILWEAV